MFRRRILKIVTHPLLVSALLTLLLSILFFPELPRYRFIFTDTLLTPDQMTSFFSDLDNDGSSEEINVTYADPLLKIVIRKGPAFVSQYNLRSSPLRNEYLSTGDTDGDGMKEILVLTHRHDSVLLNIIDPVGSRGTMLKDRLVYYCDSIHYELDIPESTAVGMVNFGEGSGSSFLFSMTTGYSKFPRNLFRYDIARDQLYVSPLMGVAVYDPLVFDLNSDGVPEILFQTSATGNFHYPVPFSDQSSWLMVLDKDLQFMFDPVEFKGSPSYLQVAPFRTGTECYLAVCHDSYGMDSPDPGIYIFDLQGHPLERRMLVPGQGEHYYISVTQESHGPLIHVLNATEGTIMVLDGKLHEQKVQKARPLYRAVPFSFLDVDRDGHLDYLCFAEVMGAFVILRDDFSDGVLVDPGEDHYPVYATPFLKDGEHQVYVQYPGRGYMGKYEKNPLFFWRIPGIFIFYCLISALLFGLYRILQYRARMQFQTQKKIGELQILALKNQIDPHFTFNILNAIGSLYSRNNNKPETYDVFVKYSRLLRETIQNSDKISIPLRDELDFVKNYIELEKCRTEPSFTCTWLLSPEVDPSIHIPRMLVHSFVENAIKHGIRARRDGGELTIEVNRTGRTNQISVRDNGPGPATRSQAGHHSTGKGLHIVNELITLFNSLEGTRISYQMKEIRDHGTIAGTEVTITIPC